MRTSQLKWAAVFAALVVCPAFAEAPPVVRLCPPTVLKTCFIGYVTAADRIVVLLSSGMHDELIDKEVEIVGVPDQLGGKPSEGLDLTAQLGRVVMLDAVGGEPIYNARLVFVADPILTALYLALAAPRR